MAQLAGWDSVPKQDWKPPSGQVPRTTCNHAMEAAANTQPAFSIQRCTGLRPTETGCNLMQSIAKQVQDDQYIDLMQVQVQVDIAPQLNTPWRGTCDENSQWPPKWAGLPDIHGRCDSDLRDSCCMHMIVCERKVLARQMFEGFVFGFGPESIRE